MYIPFVGADIRSYEPQEQYDAVISLFHVMSYRNENEDILVTFQSARKALNQGGLFLSDVCHEVLVIDKDTSQTKVINEVHNMRYFFRSKV